MTELLLFVTVCKRYFFAAGSKVEVVPVGLAVSGKEEIGPRGESFKIGPAPHHLQPLHLSQKHLKAHSMERIC